MVSLKPTEYVESDILVKVEAQTMDKVSKVVNHRLKNLKNIKSTLTMVAIRNS
jgi:DNA-binding Lrp family transcriptional regulator